MGTLKSTLKVESKDLFPVPVSIFTTNNNVIGGNYSGFNTVTLSSGDNFLATISAGNAFLYVATPSTNVSTVVLTMPSGAGAGAVLGFNNLSVFQSPGTYFPSAVTATTSVSGGSGTGLGVIVSTNAFSNVAWISVDPSNTGSGYAIGDTIVIDGAALGGTTGVDDVTVDIDALIPSASFATIQPGDVGFFPIGNSTSYDLTANPNNAGDKINFFIGIRQ